MSTYLSIRKRPAGGLSFYAVTNVWNKNKKLQEKKQEYIGSCTAKGYKFNEKALRFENILDGTEHQSAFADWLDTMKEDPEGKELVSISEIGHSRSILVGLHLLLGKLAADCGLGPLLSRHFEEQLSGRMLALAYFCAVHNRRPLHDFCLWSTMHKLPCGPMSEFDLNKTLQTFPIERIPGFLDEWFLMNTKEDLICAQISPMNSIHRNNEEIPIAHLQGMTYRDPGKGMLLINAKTQIPCWWRLLSFDSSDIKTINEIRIRLDGIRSEANIVLDRSFATYDNIMYLIQNGVSFTIGLPIENFPTFQQEINGFLRHDAFERQEQTLEIYNRDEILKTKAISTEHWFHGRRVYVHYYFIKAYHQRAAELLKERLKRVEEKLEHQSPINDPYEKKLAQQCFVVRITSADGRIVKPVPAVINQMLKTIAGYFAVMSSEFSDPLKALRAYKIREGLEDRLDDLQNEKDFYRLKVYERRREICRAFIQFLAEILRCKVLSSLHEWENRPAEIKSVTELLTRAAQVRQISIHGHRPFYESIDATQKAILRHFGVDLTK